MAAKTDKTGEISTNKFGSTIIIVGYRFYNDVDIYFPDYDWTAFNVQYNQFKLGTIKCPYEPRCCGVGFIGEGSYIEDSRSKTYITWYNMLRRCYNENLRIMNPTYDNCFVCDEWLNYQNFAQWYNENYYELDDESVAIDKDILYKGNCVYSPETCIFAPQRINSLFTKSNACRGDLPIGVQRFKNKFVSSCSDGHYSIHLGVFDTIDEAFNTYKNFKENLIKQVADEYVGFIPQKLYNALYNYEVNIDD